MNIIPPDTKGRISTYLNYKELVRLCICGNSVTFVSARNVRYLQNKDIYDTIIKMQQHWSNKNRIIIEKIGLNITCKEFIDSGNTGLNLHDIVVLEKLLDSENPELKSWILMNYRREDGIVLKITVKSILENFFESNKPIETGIIINGHLLKKKIRVYTRDRYRYIVLPQNILDVSNNVKYNFMSWSYICRNTS